jgi:hypothetical protein
MKRFTDVIAGNVPWVITTLLAVGAFGATVKYQGEKVAVVERCVTVERSRVDNIEKNLIRLEQVQIDIQEIKEDIRDIKRIILRPAITLNTLNTLNTANTLSETGRNDIAKNKQI